MDNSFSTCSRYVRAFAFLFGVLLLSIFLQPDAAAQGLIGAPISGCCWGRNNYVYEELDLHYEMAIVILRSLTLASFGAGLLYGSQSITQSVHKARQWQANGASERVSRMLINRSLSRTTVSLILFPIMVHLTGITYLLNNFSYGWYKTCLDSVARL